MNQSFTYPNTPKETFAAVHALFQALGNPHPVEVDFGDQRFSGGVMFGEYFHPIFSLSEHFLSFDTGNIGYTNNQYRGDHLSIPGWTENGEVCVLEASFHKGNTCVAYLVFPDVQKEVHQALLELLQALETR
jgi:hypothetical protein